ncbi:MAG TPA: FecR domain-containing protein, partial [Opitutus sp.]|nr:FecR domain-containing protein [Opitutus sp.]
MKIELHRVMPGGYLGCIPDRTPVLAYLTDPAHMKSSTKLRFFSALCAFAGAIVASAHEANVLKVSGAAEVQLSGQSSAQPLTAGMQVPEGATIKTAAGGQVYLETAPGVVATIESDSTVVVEKLNIEKQGETVILQEALLDLKKGNIISTLDPTKKSINRYGVRTPKGVAAARGTVYGTSVTFSATGESNTTVATMTGVVTLNLGNGVTVDVPFGQAASGGSEQAEMTTATLEAAIAASGQSGLTVAALLQEAVNAVAGNVAANTSAAGGNDTATAVLAAVVSAASAAQPSQASAFVATAVAAAVTTGSATGGAGSNSAVAAIVEAAVRAAPASAAGIAQTAASTVVEVKVTEAAAAATAAGGDAAAVAAAVAEASANAEATLQTIAETAVNTSAAVG